MIAIHPTHAELCVLAAINQLNLLQVKCGFIASLLDKLD